MIGNFMQLTPSELQAMIDDPSLIEARLFPDVEEDEEVGIDVDKAWHGIHFLLTGSDWEGDPPLANMILGGCEIGEDVGYGPARYLTAKQVQDVANALPSREKLATRFDIPKMNQAKIYPEIWNEGDEMLDYVLTNYETLADYYKDAATKGNAMLKFLN